MREVSEEVYGDLGAETLSRQLNHHIMSRESFFCAIEAYCFINVASCVNVVVNTLNNYN